MSLQFQISKYDKRGSTVYDKSFFIHLSTVDCSVVLRSEVLYRTMLYSTALKCGTVHCIAVL